MLQMFTLRQVSANRRLDGNFGEMLGACVHECQAQKVLWHLTQQEACVGQSRKRAVQLCYGARWNLSLPGKDCEASSSWVLTTGGRDGKLTALEN